MANKRFAPDIRSTGGIDIGVAGRPGGVPMHITSVPTSAAGAGNVQRLAVYAKPATIDPFAGIGRLRRAIANRLAQ